MGCCEKPDEEFATVERNRSMDSTEGLEVSALVIEIAKNASPKASETKMAANDLQRELDKRNIRAVFWLRVLVVASLLVTSLAVSLTVYFLSRGAQRAEFEAHWQGASARLLQSFQNIIGRKLGAVGNLEVAAIAESLYHGEAWPFLTMPAWEERASTARSLSGSLYVSISPVVANGTMRTEWEAYSSGNASKWIADSWEYQKRLGLNRFDKSSPNANIAPQFSKEIFYVVNDRGSDDWMKRVDDGPGPYLPVWQTSPVLQNTEVNLNLFRSPLHAEGVRTCVDTKSVVIGRMETASVGDSQSLDHYTAFYANLLSIDENSTLEYQGDPMTFAYFPVFSSFDTNRELVAVMIDLIHWMSYLSDVLPSNVPKIYAVLENGCGEAHAYEVVGEDAFTLGPGRLYDTEYHRYEQSASIQDVKIDDGSSLGLDLNLDVCRSITLRLYPSREYEKLFLPFSPAMVTIAVAMVFLFTSIMFIIYDRLVERRQYLLWKRASQSTQIVSSLFPKRVRDVLMEECTPIKRRHSSSLVSRYLRRESNESTSNEGTIDLPPIAEQFTEASVFFSDLAGFTAWSSQRTPVEVFSLLQKLYAAMDELAAEHDVWKVETIGDAYMACTGVPDKQKDHAVILVRFAAACLARMEKLVTELAVTLGDDTKQLSMRIGINSGGVMGGVLRGVRARFQLFGDTVNLASRMESTGIPGKIQVSQITADLLIAAGKESWLIARSDAVEAKGKGTLNTFFVSPA